MPAIPGLSRAQAAKLFTTKASLVVPSSVYRTLLSCKQTLGAAMDRSGRGGDAIPPAATYGPTQLWANAGYLSTGTGTGLGASIAANKSSFDLATQSVILGFVINMAQPAGNPALMGNADAATRRGIYLGARTDGKLRILVNTSDGLVAALAIPTPIVFDGTDHHVVVAFDSTTRSIFVFIDGRFVAVYPNYWTGNTAGIVDTFNIGGGGGIISALSTTAYKLHSFHMIVLTGGVPSNLGQVARKLYEAPGTAVPESSILPTKKTVLAVVGPGQSNEVGSGLWLSSNSDYGYPLSDPVAPNGAASRSMWPLLSDKLGQRGVWADFLNTAKGSTSATSSWCGHIRTWATNLAVGRGSYVLSDGALWRANLAEAVVVTSTVAPTGTANVTTSDTIPWVYVGAPLGYEVNGYVMKDGDRGFDPNGYFAAAVAAAAARGTGYTEKWALISIGQGDRTMNAPRAAYKQALINATQFWLTRGFRVALGFTCYAGTAGAEAWYQSDLLPGYADALAFFAGNANVAAGANLRTALGVLPVTPNAGIPGLKSDQLHMNDEAYALASAAWDSALAAAGWA